MKTKIFCDTADYKIIKKFTESFLVQGFTTNPSLMRLAGAKNYENYAKKILRICSNKPISFEVFADDSNEMIKQGLKIKEWGKNVYVKIPVTNSKGKFSGKAIKYLSHRNVKLNITAVYTVHQTIKIIRNLNKNTKSIISIFAGRMSDVGKDPVPIIKECVKLSKKNNKIIKHKFLTKRIPFGRRHLKGYVAVTGWDFPSKAVSTFSIEPCESHR